MKRIIPTIQEQAGNNLANMQENVDRLNEMIADIGKELDLVAKVVPIQYEVIVEKQKDSTLTDEEIEELKIALGLNR